MSDNGHLHHAATLRKLQEEGWFREPLRSQVLAMLRESQKARAEMAVRKQGVEEHAADERTQDENRWHDRIGGEG